LVAHDRAMPRVKSGRGGRARHRRCKRLGQERARVHVRIGHVRARARVCIVVKTRAPPRAPDANGPRTNSVAASEESWGGVRDTLNIYMGSKISVRSTLLKQDALGHLFLRDLGGSFSRALGEIRGGACLVHIWEFRGGLSLGVVFRQS
jgi:hypothetical protein